MSETQANQWLEWICSSENLDELQENYNGWADTYETDISGVWKPVPIAAALMVAKYLEDKDNPILDVGAGTGLVGVALAAMGFKNIIGMDISPMMLAKAAEKAVYSSLICCSIGDEKFRDLDQANAVIATGVFAHSHAGSAELKLLEEIIKPGGILVFTARESFLSQLQESIEHLPWTEMESKVMPIYDDPVYLQVYKAANITK